MQKTSSLFDSRNTTKQSLEFSHVSKVVKPGHIWIAKVGVNLGSEVSKDGDYSRPVLILKTHLGGDLVSIIPLTSKFHEVHSYQYVYFDEWKKFGLDVPSYFLLNQVKTISMKRLTRRINDVSGTRYIPVLPYTYRKMLQEKIIAFLFLHN